MKLERLLSSAQTDVDLTYARMIDGRTIHQYLLFVRRYTDSSSQLPRRSGRTDGHETLGFVHLLGEKRDRGDQSLFEASCTLADKFLEADSAISAEKPSDVVASAYRSAFAASVVAESERRLGRAQSPWRMRPEEILELCWKLPRAGLSAELLAYWYPGWRRSLIIFESPLDFHSGPESVAQAVRGLPRR